MDTQPTQSTPPSNSPTVMQLEPGQEPKAPTQHWASLRNFLRSLPGFYKMLLVLGIVLPLPTLVVLLLLLAFQGSDSVSMVGWYLLATAIPLFLWTVVLPALIIGSVVMMVKRLRLKPMLFFVLVIGLSILPYLFTSDRENSPGANNLFFRPVDSVMSVLDLSAEEY